MKRIATIFLGAALLLHGQKILRPTTNPNNVAVAQDTDNRAHSVNATTAPAEKDSFISMKPVDIDTRLHQMLNPTDHDYGADIAQWRANIARNTIENPWAVAAFLLSLTVVFLIFRHRFTVIDNKRLIWDIAGYVADLKNSRNDAVAQAMEATNRYNKHVELCNRDWEAEQSGMTLRGSSGQQVTELNALRSVVSALREKNGLLEKDLREKDDYVTQQSKKLQEFSTQLRKLESGAQPNKDVDSGSSPSDLEDKVQKLIHENTLLKQKLSHVTAINGIKDVQL